MLPHVLEHVDDGVPHLARRREHARVVSVAPDTPATSERAVDRSGDPDRKPLETTPKRPLFVRLDQKMDVIALCTELNDAEMISGCGAERSAERDEHPFGAQRRQMTTRSQRHVHGTARIMGRTATMSDTTPTPTRLPSGAGTRAAPGSKGQIELRFRPHLVGQIL
jgi:hypothetical protein